MKAKVICLSAVLLVVFWGHCDAAKAPNPRDWIPTFRFHKKHKCYPDTASQHRDRKCASFNSNAPVYWSGQKCGNTGYKLQYWLWYGWQSGCLGRIGSHGNDWEHVIVNFRRCGDKYCPVSVTYSQHGGHYTRKYTGRIDVYVGNIAHGNYHGTRPKTIQRCTYFGDLRGSHKVWRPSNLKALTSLEGSQDPMQRSGYEKGVRRNSCDIKKCVGNNRIGWGKAGCRANNANIF